MKKVIKITYRGYDSRSSDELKTGYLEFLDNKVEVRFNVSLATVFNFSNDALATFIASSHAFGHCISKNCYTVESIEICDVDIVATDKSISVTDIVEY